MKLLSVLAVIATVFFGQKEQQVTAINLNNVWKRPLVGQNDELISDIDLFKGVINAIFQGLGLDSFLNGEEACFDDLELMLWYYYYSYDGIIEADELYNGTLSLTKAIGTTSPVLRKCYNFSEENEGQWKFLAERLFNFENLWTAVRSNLISSYTEIDTMAWGALLMYKSGRITEQFVLISRIVSLMVIQGLEPEETEYDPINNPMVGSVHKSILETRGKYTKKQNIFMDILKTMNAGEYDRDEYIEDYLHRKRQDLHEGKPNVMADQVAGLPRGSFLYPAWPYPFTVNVFHSSFEYLYEFMRGSRLASTNQLDLCEAPVSSYFESQQAAYDYIELGLQADDGEIITEGIFRLGDTLTWLTPIFVTCHLTQVYINLTLFNEVWANFVAPYKLFLNLMRNQFNLTSDLVVLLSNWFYKDYFSMSFWLGDIFYQIAVYQTMPYDVTDLFDDSDHYEESDHENE